MNINFWEVLHYTIITSPFESIKTMFYDQVLRRFPRDFSLLRLDYSFTLHKINNNFNHMMMIMFFSSLVVVVPVCKPLRNNLIR